MIDSGELVELLMIGLPGVAIGGLLLFYAFVELVRYDKGEVRCDDQKAEEPKVRMIRFRRRSK